MRFLVFLNQNFDYLVAVLLGILLGGTAAGISVRLRFLDIREWAPKIVFYSFIISFAFCLMASYVVATLDPDFSIPYRYRMALREIKSWFWMKDPLLEPDGLEQALSLGTGWVNRPEKLFYVIGDTLYSVMTNGREEKTRFAAQEPIRAAVFSPDGKKIALRTGRALFVLSLADDRVVYQYPLSSADSLNGVISQLGAVQWSPDSQKLCFFDEKKSRASAQTRWYVYDLGTQKEILLSLETHQDAFLIWGCGSQRLFFRKVYSGQATGETPYRIMWYAIDLSSRRPVLAADIRYEQMETPPEYLAAHGVDLCAQDIRLRFESRQPFLHTTGIKSESGKSLSLNTDLQLCYTSAVGVRYRLFGISPLSKYFTLAPKGTGSDLEIEEARWTPSDQYVLLRHVTHGLLLLHPVKRKVGVLVPGRVDLFGMYPGKS